MSYQIIEQKTIIKRCQTTAYFMQLSLLAASSLHAKIAKNSKIPVESTATFPTAEIPNGLVAPEYKKTLMDFALYATKYMEILHKPITYCIISS